MTQAALAAERTRLSGDTPWVVVTAAPLAPVVSPSHPVSASTEWVRREVTTWPAPIPIAPEPSAVREDRVIISSADAADPAGIGYHYEFSGTGAALIGIAVGRRIQSPVDGARVWAVGEGAVAWIVIAALRLAASHAHRIGVRSEIVVEAAITTPADTTVVPLEIWNHDRGEYAPAGRRAVQVVASRRRTAVDACLSADLVRVARPLIVGIAQQFALPGDRHVDEDGVLRLDGFTGNGDRIQTWADAIGVASRP